MMRNIIARKGVKCQGNRKAGGVSESPGGWLGAGKAKQPHEMIYQLYIPVLHLVSKQ